MKASRLRILHVIPSYLPAVRYGGPVYAVHDLCRHLVQRGHRVDVYTTNVDGPGVHDSATGTAVCLDGVSVYYFPVQFPRRLYYSPQLARALAARIEQYDVLHLHSLFLYPTLAAARCANSRGVPYLLAPRGMLVKELVRRRSPLLKMAWIQLFERRSLEQASAIQATSRLEARELRKFPFDWPNIFIVPNGLEPPTPRPGVQRDPKRVLFLGRVNWKKGLDRLIPAMAGLPGLTLTVAGNDEDDYTRVLKNLVALHGLEDRIEFCGPVWGDEKWRLYQRAGVFVLPSYSENFANTVLEAMAMACPVIVTAQVGLAEVVAGCGAGLVSNADADSLRGAIATVVSDPEQARRMGEAGRGVIADRFSWPAIAATVETTYRRLWTDIEVPADA